LLAKLKAEAQPHHFGFGALPPTVVAQLFDLKPAQHANTLASGSKGINAVASGSTSSSSLFVYLGLFTDFFCFVASTSS
jgi:hypothetical protein